MGGWRSVLVIIHQVSSLHNLIKRLRKQLRRYLNRLLAFVQRNILKNDIWIFNFIERFIVAATFLFFTITETATVFLGTLLLAEIV